MSAAMAEQGFEVRSPSGDSIKVDRNLFRALKMCLGPEKMNAVVMVECKNGGIAGIKMNLVLK